jgi:hypothetical protein
MMFRMKKVFYGGYDSVNEIWTDFFEEYGGGTRTGDDAPPDDFPENSQIIYAWSGGDGYDESSFVVYMSKGKLMVNNASHCSCYGFEGQWNPSETTWFQLFKERHEFNSYSTEPTVAQNAWDQLVGHNCTLPVDIVGEDEKGILVSRDLKGVTVQEQFVLVPNILITSNAKETE